jgi:hypothetical protein
MAKRRSPIFVIVIVLQGRPRIIADDGGDPEIFRSMEAARDFTCRPHMAIEAAESIVILNCNTGETETL